MPSWTSTSVGISGFSPSTCALTQEPKTISGAAVPYSVQVEIPYVEIELDPAGFEGAGADLVRWAFTYEMADDKSLLDATEPITITVVNDVAAY